MKSIVIVLVAGALAFGTTGCDPVDITGGANGKYHLVVVLEKDLNGTGFDYAYVEFRRDGTAFADAVVVIDGDSLDVSSGTATRATPQIALTFGRAVQITAVDKSSDFSYSAAVTMPQSIAITEFFPENRLLQGATSPSLVWTASQGVSGYFISVRAATQPTLAEEYSATVAVQDGPSTSVPNETFYNPGSIDLLVEDIYYFYVVGYASAFYQRPGAAYRIPGTPAQTISENDVSGTIAAMVVAKRDSIDAHQAP